MNIDTGGGELLFRLPGDVTLEAVQYLHAKQGVAGTADQYVKGYVIEIDHMLRRRLDLLSPDEAALVQKMHPVVSLRPQLEAKKDGRCKMRLLLQGFKEPEEWDIGSNASPVAQYSSIRSLLFQKGPETDIVASIDISVAFLQAEEYSKDSAPRYVSLRAYRGAQKHVFRLTGPIYGQRSAPRAFYNTLLDWLVKDMGYIRAKNDPCVFRNEVTGHRLVCWVDDILTRGSKESTDAFFEALARRFDCKDPEYLTEGDKIVYTGWEISMFKKGGDTWYKLSQEVEMNRFLGDIGMESGPTRVAPMADRAVMVDGTPITAEERQWCRAAIGSLNHFVRSTRWDIAHTVARLSQHMQNPTLGTKNAIHILCGYLRGTKGLSLECRVADGVDTYEIYVDSDHHGDRKLGTRSHSGLIVFLNGTPVHWRSNKQPVTSLSPAEAEVYAMSEGSRDAKHVAWVLEEFGREVTWPLQVKSDSSGAVAFQGGNVHSAIVVTFASSMLKVISYKLRWEGWSTRVTDAQSRRGGSTRARTHTRRRLKDPHERHSNS